MLCALLWIVVVILLVVCGCQHWMICRLEAAIKSYKDGIQ